MSRRVPRRRRGQLSPIQSSTLFLLFGLVAAGKNDTSLTGMPSGRSASALRQWEGATPRYQCSSSLLSQTNQGRFFDSLIMRRPRKKCRNGTMASLFALFCNYEEYWRGLPEEEEARGGHPLEPACPAATDGLEGPLDKETSLREFSVA